MEKKKVLVFHPALKPYRIDFFNLLSQAYNTRFYFSWSEVHGQELNLKLKNYGVQFHYNLLKSGFEIKNRLIRFGVTKLVKREKPNIVLCSEYSQITIVLILYRYFTRQKFKLYTISDDSIKYSEHRKGFRKWIRTFVSKGVDGIIFPSKAVGKWFLSHVNPTTKIMELPIIHSNGYFRTKLKTTLNEAEKNILEHHLLDKKVFLFVGRLVALKNIDRILKAFARTESKQNHLVIIGDGEEEKKLKHLAFELHLTQNCTFLGWKEGADLLAWYNAGQCLILASYREAYGAVVNEALLAGNKVLVSNYAGAAVLVNEKNGATFDPYNIEQMAEQINNMASTLQPVKLPLKLKPDLMPFTLDEKLKVLYSQL